MIGQVYSEKYHLRKTFMRDSWKIFEFGIFFQDAVSQFILIFHSLFISQNELLMICVNPLIGSAQKRRRSHSLADVVNYGMKMQKIDWFWFFIPFKVPENNLLVLQFHNSDLPNICLPGNNCWRSSSQGFQLILSFRHQ